MNNKMTVGKKELARDLVEKHGYTQEKVAKFMEVSQSTISKVIKEDKKGKSGKTKIVRFPE